MNRANVWRPDLGAPTGIVLAGGRSSRFGRDKLTEPIDGEPLVWRPIRALASAGCAELIVVIPPTGGEPPIPDDLSLSIRLVRDRESFGGPLSGAATGLAALDDGPSEGPVLLVGGDQPSLVPVVLADLAGRIGAGVAAAVLADASGHWRPLPMAVARGPATQASGELLAADERRLRALATRLQTLVVAFEDWSGLDRSGDTLADIDLPADLPGLG